MSKKLKNSITNN